MSSYDLLLDNLKLYMCRKMMLDKKSVEFMAMVKLGPANTQVWEEFYNSAESVLDTLMQGRDAKIEIKNYLASVSDDFTQEDFEEVLKPFINDPFVEEMRREKNKPDEDDGFIYAPDVKWD